MAESINKSRIDLLVIGGSAGSLEVILKAFPQLTTDLPFAIILVLHRKQNTDTTLIDLLSAKTKITVIEANEKELIKAGCIYVAPADYHLLIENDHTLSLDYSEKVNFSRPCIDITFQTAAETYKDRLACLLMSGASADGVEGLELVKTLQGITAVQDPKTAEVSYMPQKALDKMEVDYIVETDKVFDFINMLAKSSELTA
ncbi:chemotaxis protein CheB [Daejeonella lutea]|uniref:protein-glutamate methylesterase n=1 Tax=Daejeonella lutea TaxID=572036 RepID=A0A1T5F0T4_9SPHI|nr:chemotaxis protein CheB [Daejeonella lutea]SKB89736.1 two-component system, chemotaxis family, response regulator CheB [Daejeonella lutea]